MDSPFRLQRFRISLRNLRSAGSFSLLLVLAVLASAAIGLVSAKLSPTVSQQAAILALLALPAFLLALFHVKLLVPYNLLVWAIAPEIRRVADWAEGTYHSVSLLSLAPVFTAAMVIIPVFVHIHKLERKWVRILTCFAIALGYAGLIGIALNGMGSLYDLANYIIPLLLVPFFAIRPFDAKELDHTLRMFSLIAVLVAIYGIVQYVTVPPWDAFWMNHAGMNSIGKPYPLEIRVFSTLNSPGPTAIFLTCALVPMVVERRWRGVLGWVGVLLVTVCLLTTLVRSAWIVLVVMLLTYLATSSGRRKGLLLLQVVFVAGALFYAVPKLPGAEGLVSRMETMGDLKEDDSYNARFELLTSMVPTILANPVGSGTGSVGTGTKLGNDGDLGPLGIMDNGFLGLFITFGLPGGLLFFAGLFAVARWLWSRLRIERASPTPGSGRDLYLRLALASWAGAFAGLISDNGFPGMRGYLIWMLIGMGVMGSMKIRARSGITEQREDTHAAVEHQPASA